MIVVQGMSRVYTGEQDQILMPTQQPAAPAYPVLFIHGAEAGPGALDWMTASEYRWPIFREIVDGCRLTGISADIGGNATWGNSTVLSRMDSMYTYAQSLSGTKNGKVILVGQSMGGLASIVWARSNASKVAALVGIIPVTNLTHAHTTMYGPAIDAAYGGAYSEAAYGSAHNPVTFAADLSGIPGKLYTGSSDTLARLQDAESVSSGASSIETVALSGGHSESTLANIDLADLRAFLLAHST